MIRKASVAVGTLAWETQGGPPLTNTQKAKLLLGYGSILTANLITRCWRLLTQRVPLSQGAPGRVGLETWAPPDSRAAREAEKYVREVSSIAMANHSYRTYYFAALLNQ